MAKRAESNTDTGSGGSGSFDLFWRLLAALGGGADPDRQKRRQLKEIAKQLKRQKHSFYKPKSGEVLPALGRFFYDIYKAVAPAKLLIDHASESSVLKTIVIERFLTDTQREIQGDFEEEAIRNKLETGDPKQLVAEYKEKIISYFAGFDAATTRQINAMYDLLLRFLQFIRFDFYFVIKKFDSSMPENDFKFRPHMETINGEYVCDDIKDFLEAASLIDAKADWPGLFDLLRVYKGTEVMPEKAWKPVMSSLTDVLQSGVLLLIVRHLDEDPGYSVSVSFAEHNIVEEYLNKIRNQTEITIQKILNERRTNKIESLATAVFGTASVSRMRNYTDKANLSFAKKMLGGYTYVQPMNYLKAFLIDYIKSDIKSVVDALLIRGQWSAPVFSQQLSESFHKLLDLSSQLLEFDDGLSDEGQRGAAIKNALHKSDRDKSMMRVLRQYLDEANKDAVRIIKESAQYLIAVAKLLKSVYDDRVNKTADIITNWREIDATFEKDIESEISTIYKKIYYLTQLLQYYVKK